MRDQDFLLSGRPIYLAKSLYENFLDTYFEGNIGFDIARRANEKGSIIPMRYVYLQFLCHVLKTIVSMPQL